MNSPFQRLPNQGHQPPQIHAAAVVASAAGLAALLIAGLLVSWAMMVWLGENRRAVAPLAPADAWQQTAGAPHVIPDQALQTRRAHRVWHQQLSRYRWVDQGQQIVSIPIERAIELASQRQLQWQWPERETPTPDASPANLADEPAAHKDAAGQASASPEPARGE